MKLLVVLASVRDGRSGKNVAEWFVGQVEKDARFEVDLVDLKELGLSYEMAAAGASSIKDGQYEREEDRKWSQRVSQADAVVFITPEYNHGYPASLKNAVDHLYNEWNGKPVGFVGYGSAGAPYAIGAFGLVAAWTKMDTVNAHVGIGEIWSAFNDKGELAQANYHEYEAKTLLDSLVAKVNK